MYTGEGRLGDQRMARGRRLRAALRDRGLDGPQPRPPLHGQVPARYYPAKFHLHSCFENAASMGGHCFQAKRWGVDVVWITDHDTRICWKQDLAFWGDNFEGQQLASLEDKKGRVDGWRVAVLDDGVEGAAELAKGVSLSGKQSMRVWARSGPTREEWGSLRVDLCTKGKRHQRSLMTGVDIGLALRPERGFGENGRLRILVGLSQQPPNLDEESITYVIGEPGEDEGLVSLGDLNTGEWNTLHLDLTEDARKHTKGGIDNVFGGLSLSLDSRRGELVELYVDDFRLHQVHNCQTAYDRQKELASELSNRYGVTVYAGTEMSAFGPHKNVFGSWVPILDRNAKPEGYSEAGAIAHVKSYGGAISLNHPFSKWKSEVLTEENREQVVRGVIESYRESRCRGADLIEVGFPEGRHGFHLKDYLKLWDGLSCAGIAIAGIGVSDAHNNRSGWESGNNFANWIRSETIEERDLVRGLLSGDIYMGDPTLFRGELEFMTAEGHRMGQIIVGKEHSEVLFRMTGCRPGWKVHWIVDGVREKALDVCDEKFEFQGVVTPQDFSFTRFEVYDEGAKCVLLTNPIYFARRRLAEFPSHKVSAKRRNTFS